MQLNESKDYNVYHVTNFSKAEAIIKSNTMKGANYEYGSNFAPNNPNGVDKRGKYVCFTRSNSYIFGGHSEKVRFTVDMQAMDNRFKVMPYSFVNHDFAEDEYEERVYTKEIKNFDKYVVEVDVVNNGVNSIRTRLDKLNIATTKQFMDYMKKVEIRRDLEPLQFLYDILNSNYKLGYALQSIKDSLDKGTSIEDINVVSNKSVDKRDIIRNINRSKIVRKMKLKNKPKVQSKGGAMYKKGVELIKEVDSLVLGKRDDGYIIFKDGKIVKDGKSYLRKLSKEDGERIFDNLVSGKDKKELLNSEKTALVKSITGLDNVNVNKLGITTSTLDIGDMSLTFKVHTKLAGIVLYIPFEGDGTQFSKYLEDSDIFDILFKVGLGVKANKTSKGEFVFSNINDIKSLDDIDVNHYKELWKQTIEVVERVSSILNHKADNAPQELTPKALIDNLLGIDVGLTSVGDVLVKNQSIGDGISTSLKIGKKSILWDVMAQNIDIDILNDVLNSKDGQAINKKLDFVLTSKGNDHKFRKQYKKDEITNNDIQLVYTDYLKIVDTILRAKDLASKPNVNMEGSSVTTEVISKGDSKLEMQVSKTDKGRYIDSFKILTNGILKVESESHNLGTTYDGVLTQLVIIEELLKEGWVNAIANFINKFSISTLNQDFKRLQAHREDGAYDEYYNKLSEKLALLKEELKDLAIAKKALYAQKGDNILVALPISFEAVKMLEKGRDSITLVLKDYTNLKDGNIKDEFDVNFRYTEVKGKKDPINTFKSSPLGVNDIIVNSIEKTIKLLKSWNAPNKPASEITGVSIDDNDEGGLKAETKAKVNSSFTPDQKAQLARLQVVAKKFASQIDEYPEMNLIFLEEPREINKYDLPVPVLGFICYDMDNTIATLDKHYLTKLITRARGTKIFLRWHRTTDMQNKKCWMTMYCDSKWADENGVDYRKIKYRNKKLRLNESIGGNIQINGISHILESVHDNYIVVSKGDIEFDIPYDSLDINESTQVSSVSMDVKDSFLIDVKKRNKKLKLKI